MTKALFNLVTTAVVAVVVATTLLAVGLAGAASTPSSVVAPVHLCPPMC